jgi:hypothetical protein
MTTRFAAALLASVCGGLLGYEMERHSVAAAQGTTGGVAPAEVKPFIAKRREASYPPGPNAQPKVLVRNLARRSDGSTVERYEVASPSGEFGEVIDGSDLRIGKGFVLEPFTRSLTTFYLSDREIGQRRAAQDACGESEVRTALSAAPRTSEPRPAVLGFDLVRVDYAPPSSRRVEIVRWVAPSLGCLALRETQSFPATGGHNDLEIVGLNQAEPPDSAFDIPDGYVERSPAEVEAAYSAKYGKPYYGQPAVAAIDKRYHDHQTYRRN